MPGLADPDLEALALRLAEDLAGVLVHHPSFLLFEQEKATARLALAQAWRRKRAHPGTATRPTNGCRTPPAP
ncbi:hypothetical protein Col01nite_21960 [Cellulomonas oligotrophica]|uniref:Uncharacterized protein n=1 Tax=Cellulomonas oligotrophica TaxID=931536 RepID=A0ABQ4DBD2_9CELL|nr:hypothetical protein Col01nite_21960 [Cellulomonas oligotrophica]